MEFQILPTSDSKSWRIESDGNTLGTVERVMTGYIVTYAEKKTKRYRMVDALREALGDEAVIKMPSQS